MLTRKGSCVTRIMKSSAGSRGSRRRHGEEKGSPTWPLALGRTVASATAFMNRLLDRLRRDALTLAQRVGVLRGAGVVDRGGLHRRQRGRCEGLGCLLVLRDAVRGQARSRRDRRPAALHTRPGRLEVLRPGRPRDVLPGVAWVTRAPWDGERPGPQPTRRLRLEHGREGEAVLAFHWAIAGLEETGGDRRVVPHRHLARLVLRHALVIARVRRVLLTGVLHQVRVEVEGGLE